MKSQEHPDLLDHEYDGIREYDNPTPGWWHAIFIASILFSAVYYVFWHFSPLAWTVQQAWDREQLADYKRVFGAVGDLKPDEPTFLAMMDDPKMMSIAKSTFIANCSVCHAKDGSGINGVNLTDDNYKNVKVMGDIFTVIAKGANLGAMPSWEKTLSTNERVILTSYVASLRGQNLPGRAPEGDVIPAWPTKSAPAAGASN